MFIIRAIKKAEHHVLPFFHLFSTTRGERIGLIVIRHIGRGFAHHIKENVFRVCPELRDGGGIIIHAHQAHDEETGYGQAETAANKGHGIAAGLPANNIKLAGAEHQKGAQQFPAHHDNPGS